MDGHEAGGAGGVQHEAGSQQVVDVGQTGPQDGRADVGGGVVVHGAVHSRVGKGVVLVHRAWISEGKKTHAGMSDRQR